MECIQEIMLESYETRDWNMVGRGFLEGFPAVNINGQSTGVVVAWNEMLFTKVDSRMGQFSMAVKLKRHSDELQVVVVSIYGPALVRRRAKLWGELDKMVAVF